MTFFKPYTVHMATCFKTALAGQAQVVCRDLIETKPPDANSKSLSGDTPFLLGSHHLGGISPSFAPVVDINTHHHRGINYPAMASRFK